MPGGYCFFSEGYSGEDFGLFPWRRLRLSLQILLHQQLEALTGFQWDDLRISDQR